VCSHPSFSGVQEYKIHNCDLLFKEDSTVDDLIDVIEGNRRYVKCEWSRRVNRRARGGRASGALRAGGAVQAAGLAGC